MNVRPPVLRSKAQAIVWSSGRPTAGLAVRIGVIIIVGLVALRIESLGAEALLLSLAGFFFGLLLIEPAFLKAADKDAID